MDESGRVLVVDDSPEITKIVGRVLSKKGIDFATAGSGEEALHVLETGSVEVVLTDYQMGKMDGVELCRRVRGRFPETEVVGMSSQDVRGAFAAAGARGFLLKPFSPKDLIAAVTAATKRHGAADKQS